MILNGWHKLSGCGYKGYIIKTTGEGLPRLAFNGNYFDNINAEVYTATITYMGYDYNDKILLELEISPSQGISTLLLKHESILLREQCVLSMEGMAMAAVLRTIEYQLDKILSNPLHQLHIDREKDLIKSNTHTMQSSSVRMPSFDEYIVKRRFDKTNDYVDMDGLIPTSQNGKISWGMDDVKTSLKDVATSTAQVLMESGPLGEAIKILKTEKAKSTIEKIKIWLKTH